MYKYFLLIQIVGQYLKYHLYHQVLLFMSQLSWLHTAPALILCLTTAFNAFLKLPFTREKECLLEMCLGLFHAPAKPITEQVGGVIPRGVSHSNSSHFGLGQGFFRVR